MKVPKDAIKEIIALTGHTVGTVTAVMKEIMSRCVDIKITVEEMTANSSTWMDI